jgi:hypothetical protein
LLICGVVDTYFVAAAEGLPTHEADAADLSDLRVRLSEVRRGIQDLLDSIGQPGYSKARVDRTVARLAREEAELAEKIENHARRSAHAAMLSDTWKLLIPQNVLGKWVGAPA